MGVEAPQQSSTLFYSNLSQRLQNTTETPLSWGTHPISCQNCLNVFKCTKYLFEVPQITLCREYNN